MDEEKFSPFTEEYKKWENATEEERKTQFAYFPLASITNEIRVRADIKLPPPKSPKMMMMPIKVNEGEEKVEAIIRWIEDAVAGFKKMKEEREKKDV